MLKVGACGYNLTGKEKSDAKRETNDFHFVLFHTPFYIFSGGKGPLVAKPLTCAIFPPDLLYHYQAIGQFKTSFLNFSAHLEVLKKYNLPPGKVLTPKNPEVLNRHIKNTVTETINKTQFFEQKIDSILTEMLVDLSRDIHNIKNTLQDVSLYTQFTQLRDAICENCDSEWTTERMCKFVHMEKSQLYSYYTKFFSSTPKADILTARIEKAKTLLENQTLYVSQIAQMCSFKSNTNFIRAFSRQEGCTPGEYAQRTRSGINLRVLYDLREELRNGVPKFVLPAASGGKHPPKLHFQGTPRTVLVAERHSIEAVPIVDIPAMQTVQPGDKITVTGELAEPPNKDWGVTLRRFGGGYDVLAQQTFPGANTLYSISYVLDTTDIKNPVQIRVNPWGREDIAPDFTVDSIIITRDLHTTNIETDERKLVYTFAEDENVLELRPGDITEYIRASGTPLYTVGRRYGKKYIKISRRANNWDGIDIYLPAMDLKPGNLYTIQAKGRIDGAAPEKAAVMFQVMPGFIWRSVAAVEDNGRFSLSHTLSIMELQTSEMIRIATNPEGAEMSLTITEIEVRK